MASDSVLPSDAALLALRPLLAAQQPETLEPSIGDFLHRTLRPVLKHQNELLLTLVADFVHEHHMAFLTRSPAEQTRTVTELLGRNVKLRYTIIGAVIGLFTRAEQLFYRQHRSEVNRRILELATQRVSSQLPLLAEVISTVGRA